MLHDIIMVIISDLEKLIAEAQKISYRRLSQIVFKNIMCSMTPEAQSN